MLKALFSNRLFMGALIFGLIVLMGCGLFYGSRVANQAPVKIYTPIEVDREASAPKPPPPGETAKSGHWHGDEWHAEPHETEKLPLVDASEKHNRVASTQQSSYPPLPPSSVPDNIPEHLKFLPEWKNGHYYRFSDDPPEWEISMEDAKRALSILKEIVRDYNPQRPISEIWEQYIEYEKMYRAYAEYELGYTPFGGGFSYNRADWQYEQTWAFPEIAELVLNNADPAFTDDFKLFEKARLIAMGEDSPDWNEHIMHDGRAFYVRGDTRYEFKWGTEERGGSIGFSRTSNPNAPLVVIYPDTTSDEELKRLGWWNFHINPYTLKPVNYQPYPIINKGAQNRR